MCLLYHKSKNIAFSLPRLPILGKWKALGQFSSYTKNFQKKPYFDYPCLTALSVIAYKLKLHYKITNAA